MSRGGPEHLSIPERLAAARTQVSKLCASLFPAGTHAAVGKSIARSDSHVDRCCDPDSSVNWQLPDAYLLNEEQRLVIAQDLVGAKYLIVEAPTAERADSLDAACAMMAEAGKLAQHCAASFRDGHVDRAEGADGYPLAMKLARLSLGAAELFKRAMREGVVGVRLVKGA